MIEIVAVGRRIDPDLKVAVADYESRLRGPYRVDWRFLPYSKSQGDEARRDEGQRILRVVDDSSYVVLLDERGENVSSPDLSAKLESIQVQSGRRVVFVVGGAYGVSQSVFDRADFIWSLSKLVLPHRIVHLVLVEQIYRAQEIARGGPYHHL